MDVSDIVSGKNYSRVSSHLFFKKKKKNKTKNRARERE